MLKRPFIYTLILAVQALTIDAQLNSRTDSILTLISKQPEKDSLNAERLCDIATEYRLFGIMDSARKYDNLVSDMLSKAGISNNISLDKWKLRLEGETYADLAATYDAGLDKFRYLYKALELFEKAKDTVDICQTYNQQLSLYDDIGYEEKATDAGNESLKLAEAAHDTNDVLLALNQMIYFYTEGKNYSKAIELASKKQQFEKNTGSSYLTLASLYSRTGQIDSARRYLQLDEAASGNLFFTAGGNTKQIEGSAFGRLNHIEGQVPVYLRCADTANAISKYTLLLSMCKKNGWHAPAANVSFWLGEIYFAQGKTKQALELSQFALSQLKALAGQSREVVEEKTGNSSTTYSVDIDTLDWKMDLYRLLADAYVKEANYKSAATYELLYRALNDSLQIQKDEKEKINLQHQLELDQVINEQNKKEEETKREMERQKYIRYGISGGLGITILFLAIVFVQMRRVRKEKQRGDDLLLNILPSEVAEELKEKGSAEAKLYEDVTVLFTDFRDFTAVSERLSPQQLVGELDTCFKAFDGIIGKYNIEKIKTVGDAYVAVAGLPTENPNHAADMVKAALEIRDFMLHRKSQIAKSPVRTVHPGGQIEQVETFEIRIGLNSGQVVAGIVGVKKFAYDIWGDTVNLAARMEQHSEPGKVNISQTTWQLVHDKFNCTHRGKIAAKNKGEIDMYFVEQM
jgi:class 3 adenylate cyclase